MIEPVGENNHATRALRRGCHFRDSHLVHGTCEQVYRHAARDCAAGDTREECVRLFEVLGDACSLVEVLVASKRHDHVNVHHESWSMRDGTAEEHHDASRRHTSRRLEEADCDVHSRACTPPGSKSDGDVLRIRLQFVECRLESKLALAERHQKSSFAPTTSVVHLVNLLLLRCSLVGEQQHTREFVLGYGRVASQHPQLAAVSVPELVEVHAFSERNESD